jgi:hypothetical protein
MTMTNAERQARFRTRRKIQGHFAAEGTPMERLDVWVSADAAHGLRVLASLYGCSAQEQLDRMIRAAIEATKHEVGPIAYSNASLAILE